MNNTISKSSSKIRLVQPSKSLIRWLCFGEKYRKGQVVQHHDLPVNNELLKRSLERKFGQDVGKIIFGFVLANQKQDIDRWRTIHEVTSIDNLLKIIDITRYIRNSLNEFWFGNYHWHVVDRKAGQWCLLEDHYVLDRVIFLPKVYADETINNYKSDKTTPDKSYDVAIAVNKSYKILSANKRRKGCQDLTEHELKDISEGTYDKDYASGFNFDHETHRSSNPSYFITDPHSVNDIDNLKEKRSNIENAGIIRNHQKQGINKIYCERKNKPLYKDIKRLSINRYIP